MDGYVDEAITRLDMVPGFDSGYIGNLGIALERAGRERTARDDVADIIVTCGSIFETSVYMAMEFEAQQEFRDEAERADDMRRIEASMKMLACLYMDTWRYRHVYYLPTLKGRGSNQRWDMFDRNLQTAFQAFQLTDVVPLTFEGSHDEIIEQRVKTITEIITTEKTLASNTEREQLESAEADRQ